MLRRNNDISTASPSVNKHSTKEQKDPNGTFEDGSTPVPATDPDVVESPPIWKDKSFQKPRQRQQITSKAALK